MDVARLGHELIAWQDVRFDESRSFAPMTAYRGRPALEGDFDWVQLSKITDTPLVLEVVLFGRPRMRVAEGETGWLLYNLAEDVIVDGWRVTQYHEVSFRIAVDVPPSATMFRVAPRHAARAMRNLA